MPLPNILREVCCCGQHLAEKQDTESALTVPSFLCRFQQIGWVAGEFHPKVVKKFSGDNSAFSSDFERNNICHRAEIIFNSHLTCLL